MIQQLQQIFRSIIKSLEVLYVIEGVKPCARILVFESEVGKILDFLNKKGLITAISGFKVMKQSAQSEFYSDRSVKIEKNSEEKGYFFIYLSKSRDIAEKARLMEERNNNRELGLILGYPECCCEFFEKYFSENSHDLTLKALENSGGYEFEFYGNIAARHFDVALLSHFPHSFECKPSIEIAKNHFKTIQKHSGQAASIFSGILKCVSIYTAEEGIFLLRNYEKKGNEIIYGDILTTAKNKLYYLLSSNKKLEIENKNSFTAGEIKIMGSNYGVMVFA